jgi:3-oxoacyl-[acyl-carrier-protein] synthase II
VVTGLGCISPLGLNLGETWSGLTAGRSGISTISHFDASALPSSIAGEATGFDPTSRLAAKEARKMDRLSSWGLVAGLEAFEDSGLEVNEANADRVGVLIGAGIGGLATIEQTTAVITKRGIDAYHRSIYQPALSIWFLETCLSCWVCAARTSQLLQPAQRALIRSGKLRE